MQIDTLGNTTKTTPRMQATLIKTEGGYNFWKLTDSSGGGPYWNITPVGQDAPKGGYRSRSYIEHIKHMQF